MHRMIRKLLCAAFALTGPMIIAAAQEPAPTSVLFENVRIFDGIGERLSDPANVLVVGNTIQSISSTAIADLPTDALLVIRGEGRTLMPGLIDNHWHTLLARSSLAELLDGDMGYANIVATREAEATLMRGFTTVR